jgi:hypothetical protein
MPTGLPLPAIPKSPARLVLRAIPKSPARLVLPAFLVLLSLQGAAQDSFYCRVPLDTPARSDFYRILLSPEIVARSQPDLSDLRILGTDGRFVPYVLKETRADAGEYQVVPKPDMLQSDSGKWRTTLSIRWSENYRIDLLSLTIRSPTLYKRDARIFSRANDGSWTLLTQTSIDPRDTVLHLPGVRTRALKIEIDNADNPPLKTTGVLAKQAALYLLAYLQTGASYALLTGNPKATTPQYDLGYFTDTLKQLPLDIGIGAPRETLTIAGGRDAAGGPDAPGARSRENPAGRAGFFLWSILTTVLLLLIYFSVKMVSAIGTKKTPDDRI